MQRGVGLAVPTAVEPEAGDLPGGRRDRVGAAQGGEGGLALQLVGVVAGGEQERGGGVRADAGQLDQTRGCGGGQTSEEFT